MKPSKENYFVDKLESNASIINPNEGEKLELTTISITFKVTSEMSNDQLGVYEISLPPMAIGAKLHYHRFMDETFIVNEGQLTMQVGNKEYKAKPGTVAYVPRFTPHGFKNDTDKTVKLTLIFNPSQKREGFFKGLYETLKEVPVDSEKYLKLYNKYDSFPIDTSNMIPIRK
ncbi:quercetin dioxygenase-like cupin family protein [Maribacter vaceletii]|uniref:Quercetin dioxygenase-like cupin family protein n=1 Tax=Maribacter vaceletii TaxID=1206816 RepID=A0A495DTW5_9FLAO|nr:cupin domain-containing protein [Maribacter vaceletii]RKR07868.1 quercetin dioxygenase-like cupin family protein [Maribacter vaceletii]